MLELLKNIGGVFAAAWDVFLMAPITCIVVIAGCIVILRFFKDCLDWANAGWPDEWPPKKK